MSETAPERVYATLPDGYAEWPEEQKREWVAALVQELNGPKPTEEES